MGKWVVLFKGILVFYNLFNSVNFEFWVINIIIVLIILVL